MPFSTSNVCLAEVDPDAGREAFDMALLFLKLLFHGILFSIHK